VIHSWCRIERRRTAMTTAATVPRWEKAAEEILAEHPIGTPVRITYGFGATDAGHLVGVRRHNSKDYPVFWVFTEGGSLIGGIDIAGWTPIPGEPLDEFSDADGIYVMECYSCGAKGTNHVFGFGRDRRCPAWRDLAECGSHEVHGVTR
jgi:hypothetical protein